MKIYFAVGLAAVLAGVSAFAFGIHSPQAVDRTSRIVNASVLVPSAPALAAPQSALAVTPVQPAPVPETALAVAGPAAIAIPASVAPQEVTQLADSATPRKPMICAVWAVHKVAENLGLVEEDAPRVADYAFPVPVPIWLVSSLVSDDSSDT